MTKTAMAQFTASPHSCYEARSALNSVLRRHAWLACAVVLGLSACAQAPKKATDNKATPLVFPLPPDEARFIYERTIRSSRDADTSIAESSLQDILTGGGSTFQIVSMQKPYAVAVHKGRIFVSEPAAGIVRVFDVPDGKYFEIGGEDPGKLVTPIGIDVDGAGNLYVADITIKAVMAYDRDGTFLRKLGGAKIGEPEWFKRLSSVAVDKKGERIYAVDIGGTVRSSPEDHRVRVFDAKTGSHLFDIGKRGSGPGEFNLAKDAALDKDNNLYVVDSANFRVQAFDAEGKFLREFGQLGKQFGSFSRPKEVTVDAAGNIYVIDTGFLNFQIFTPEGSLLMAIGTGGANDTPARYQLLSGITVDEDGRVYVVDQIFRKIDIYRPATLSAQDGYLGKKTGTDEQSSPKAPNNIIPDEKTPVSDGLEELLLE